MYGTHQFPLKYHYATRLSTPLTPFGFLRIKSQQVLNFQGCLSILQSSLSLAYCGGNSRISNK
jgi:hypothetical protein